MGSKKRGSVYRSGFFINDLTDALTIPTLE
jgi:hypothetical protein